MADPVLVFEEIPEPECLALLGRETLGRLAVVVDGAPLVFPVNYALGEDRIVFRTDPGTKLEAAMLRRVAFEVDSVDAAAGTGWSVLVQGTGAVITGAIDERSVELRALPVLPIAPGDKQEYVEVIPRSITGRRITRR
jgi:nitroimidazol reductase NimA-like FMN-containing flavoprotein (pyridoxamine 5'-phosphate oxidase superfamily)